MLKPLFLSLIWCFCGIIFTTTVSAQTTADSVSNGHTLYANIENNFYTAIGPQSRLYNGEKYEFYGPTITGNPYFMEATDWNTGTIVYDGYIYKNVSIRYDMYKDLLVIPLYKNFLKMSLISEKVASFDLLGHHFIYIKTGAPVNAGYYDQLYNGKIQVLCKHDESIQNEHGFNGSIIPYFSPSLDYYVYKNGAYFTVNSKGAFLDALKDKKKDLQQFMRANKLKFKKGEKEQAMVKIAAYYDHLTN